MSEDIFREVDEEVRQERYQQLWKRYGLYVVAATTIVILATVAVVAWRNYQAGERLAASDKFLDAVEQAEGQPQQAIDALAALTESGTAGYKLLARLRAAALLAGQGDTEAAIAQYDAVAADSGVNPLYRDLATLQSVMQGLSVMNREEAERRLAPLTADDNPWRYNAREVLAAAALAAGDSAAARAHLQSLVDDLAAPPGMRGRAAEMLAALGN